MSIAEVATPETYWHQTQRPLPSLLFLIPLLTIYEVGLLWTAQNGSDPELVRNGADTWMRWAVEQVGLNPVYLLPCVILLVFTAWQFWTKEPWRLDGEVMLGMLGESLVLAVALMVIGRLQDLVFQRIESNQVIASVSGSRDTIEYLVSFVGAGIYEETLFRLLLLPAAYYCLSAVGVPSVISMTIAMTLSALAFSSAHYIGPMADEFVWFNFIFRWLAGLFFATVFVLRGFGIAVGAHAAYDILVGVLHFQL